MNSSVINQKNKSKGNKKEMLSGYLFALPWMLGFILLMAVPLVYLTYLSLTNASLNSMTQSFNHFANYKYIFQNSDIWISVRNTVIFVVISVPVNVIFALFLGMLLNTRVRGFKIYRVVFYLPTLVTIVAIAFLWQQILAYDGILNKFLGIFGITGPDWLRSDYTALPALVLMGTWSVGGTVVIFLAGLTDVPVNLYEAADIDGANKVTKFIKITLPTLSPIIFYNLLMALIGAFQTFAQPDLMTSGAYNTNFLGYMIYNIGFGQRGQIGFAAMLCWLLLAVVMIFVGIMKFIEKKLIFYNN